MPFPFDYSDTADPLAGGKVPGNFLNFQRNFFPKNDVLECAYYFFSINKFTTMEGIKQ